MKFIGFIMALLVLILSCVPCMDEVNKGKPTDYSASYDAPASQHPPAGEDNCSPFCTCNCCAGLAFFLQNMQIIYIDPIDTEKNTVHLRLSIPEVSLPIWQPPQLG